MLTLRVVYPESFSRLQLLLRLFLGWLYIVLPHMIVLFFVLIWAKLLWLYTTFYILLKGEYPEKPQSFILGTMRWLTRVHLTTYNLRDDYPAFGVHKEVDYFELELSNEEIPNRLTVLVRFLLSGLIIFPHLFIWVFRNFWSGILTFLAFWVVLFTGKYPYNWYEFNIGTLRWLLRVLGYQLYLFNAYPPFTGEE